MHPDEIRDIARKYAEYRYPECKTYDDEALHAAARADMEEKLAFLLRDHCVVSKNVVTRYYNSAAKQAAAPCLDPRDVREKEDAKSQMLALENIFGSDLFGKEGEGCQN